jgi:Zn-dependent oligopeptidase
MATHSDNVSMNANLFAKIKKVYDAKDNQNYTGEQLALLENIQQIRTFRSIT